MSTSINIYSDGSCHLQSGIGGWGCILRCGEYEKEFSGSATKTTNQRMEMTAIIEGLKRIQWKHAEIYVKTDSGYVTRCFKDEWYIDWKNRNWFKKSDGKPVKNKELWEQLLYFNEQLNIKWQWISEDKSIYIQRCHTLAYTAMKKRFAQLKTKSEQFNNLDY